MCKQTRGQGLRNRENRRPKKHCEPICKDRYPIPSQWGRLRSGTNCRTGSGIEEKPDSFKDNWRKPWQSLWKADKWHLIRKPYGKPWSEFFHTGSGSASKNLSNIKPKNCFLALGKIIWDVHLGSQIQIFSTPDPGAKSTASRGQKSTVPQGQKSTGSRILNTVFHTARRWKGWGRDG